MKDPEGHPTEETDILEMEVYGARLVRGGEDRLRPWESRRELPVDPLCLMVSGFIDRVTIACYTHCAHNGIGVRRGA